MNDREQPTKYISVLRGVYNRLENKVEQLEKALDKACEKCMKFNKCPPITCIEIANDNDNVCKECWKKYFMKEVLEDD